MGSERHPRPARRRHRWLRWLGGIIAVPVLLIAVLNLWVLLSARGSLFSASGDPPSQAVAVVLGTSKRRANGRPNEHFSRRLDAAATLFKRGKVRHLLVSGDNRSPYYNEPRDMREGLIDRGVPAEAITCDYAGLRTLDSVVRARDVFGLRRCAIVSDGWHVPRALFVARKIGLDATGIAAPDLPLSHSLNARSREWLARVLVIIDLYFLHTRPHHSASGVERDLGALEPPASDTGPSRP